MRVIILAGGYGTRISEYTDVVPKPMIDVGGKPIIWHVMNRYAKFGYKDFIIALGYKGDVIKKYFSSYHTLQNDYTVNLSNGAVSDISQGAVDWNVTLFETGQNTMTGGRLKRLRDVIGDQPFMLTYGDGVADIDINALVDFHQSQSKIGTLTAVRPPARFGELRLNGNLISEFREKPQLNEGWINGGFFVFEKNIFDLINGDEVMLEREPLIELVKQNQLNAYRHNGFWQCMDSKREKEVLDNLVASGQASWLR